MKNIVVIFFVLILLSCSLHDRKINALHDLYGQQISFPDSILIVSNGKVEKLRYQHDSPSVLCWLDSNVCNPCAVKGLYMWEDLINIGRSDSMSFDVVFVFTPKHDNRDAILEEIKKRPTFNGILLIDDDYSFINRNQNIYKKIKYFNTYLIDSEDTVKIVGNPIRNDSMWNLYIKILKTPDL